MSQTPQEEIARLNEESAHLLRRAEKAEAGWEKACQDRNALIAALDVAKEDKEKAEARVARLEAALLRHAQLARTLAASTSGPYTREHLERRLAEADAALSPEGREP